jgi:voltage-gated potassium channel
MVGILALLASHLKRSQAMRLVVIAVVCTFVGAGLFALTQHVAYGTGLYWAITTATTVGYGDVTPKNTAGRVVAVLVMLTTIPLFASAFAFFAGTVASAHLRRLLGMERHEATGGEVVVIGGHPAIPPAVAELVTAGRDVVVVTTSDRSAFPDRVRVVAADPTSEEAVRRARPERASQVLVGGADDAAVLVSAVLVHQIAPRTPVIAIASSPNVCRALRDIGVEAVSGEELLAHTVAKSMEAPHAGELLLRILGSEGYQLREVDVGEEGVGHSLSEARERVRGVVLGAVHAGKVVVGVVEDPTLERGDRLLVLEPES